MGDFFFRGAVSRAVSTQVSRRFQGQFCFAVSGVVSWGGFIGSCGETGFRGGFRCGFISMARLVSGVVSDVVSGIGLRSKNGSGRGTWHACRIIVITAGLIEPQFGEDFSGGMTAWDLHCTLGDPCAHDLDGGSDGKTRSAATAKQKD